MTELCIEFTIECETCGRTLEGSEYPGLRIKLEPCSECLNDAHNDGYEEGKTDGFDEGVESVEKE